MIGLSCGLPVHLGQHRVGLGFGEEAAALDRRQLRRIAEHQERHAERHQVAAELGVDHRAFVDDDERGLRRRRVVPQIEARDLLAALAGLVDQAVNGGGALAALAAHHQRRLAGEGREQHLAVDLLGEVAGQRGLAGAGIAEQAEGLRRAALPGLGLEPSRDRLERGILMGGEDGHGVGKPRFPTESSMRTKLEQGISRGDMAPNIPSREQSERVRNLGRRTGLQSAASSPFGQHHMRRKMT